MEITVTEVKVLVETLSLTVGKSEQKDKHRGK
jgi:hypothetical protein